MGGWEWAGVGAEGWELEVQRQRERVRVYAIRWFSLAEVAKRGSLFGQTQSHSVQLGKKRLGKKKKKRNPPRVSYHVICIVALPGKSKESPVVALKFRKKTHRKPTQDLQ